ncbi:MAG: glycoside hydrolase family 17 [Betaproteobacteria bacterium]|nr:glycoside hydrolase family 17 [Betaproteobacteria bacterium]
MPRSHHEPQQDIETPAASSARGGRVALVLLLLGLAALLSLAYWWRLGEAVPLVDAPSPRLDCVSYTPFHRAGQTPLDPEAFVEQAQIEEDLRGLLARSGCVRIYSVSQGMDAVPGVAAGLGMKVLLGIWIGRKDADNEREIRLGVAAAKAYPRTVEAVIVGNEVLLRREQPAHRLRAIIERVRGEVKQPVSYADVWEFWLRHPELASATSFVTVHILPYWEDDPVPIEGAVHHVLDVYRQVRARFPGQEIVVGETGWPSFGRNRGGAIPGRINQARFMREFAAASAGQGLRYNVIEAFDQPWKRALEGAVGGYWGLLDAAGEAKFPVRGAVVEEPRWRWGGWAGGAGALLLLATGLARRPFPRAAGLGILALAGVGTGATAAAQARVLLLSARSPLEWALGGLYTALALILAALLARCLCAWADGQGPVPRPAPLPQVASRVLLGMSECTPAALWLGALRLAFLFGAAATSLLLVFDPRYRDFPLEWLVFPGLGFALLNLAADRAVTAGVEERVLAWVLVLAAPLIAVQEGLANLHALAWVALSLAFAGVVLRGGGVGPHAALPPEGAASALGRPGGGGVSQHKDAQQQPDR